MENAKVHSTRWREINLETSLSISKLRVAAAETRLPFFSVASPNEFERFNMNEMYTKYIIYGQMRAIEFGLIYNFGHIFIFPCFFQ